MIWQNPRLISARQRGFTLLEVVIAITLLAFISVYTAQTIQSAIKNRAKMKKDIAKASAVRDALAVISRDVEKAFHHRPIHAELYNLAFEERIRRAEEKEKSSTGKDAQKPQTGTGTNTNPTPSDTQKQNNSNNTNPTGQKVSEQLKAEYKKKDPPQLTQFIGEKETLNFTSLSHIRTRQDSPSSDQAEIGYFVRDCRPRLNKEKKSKCLWRRVSPILDDKVEEGGEETVLLEDVDRFELRYLGPGREEEWVDNWKTDQRGDAITQNKFPYAVEITLGIRDRSVDKDKAYTVTSVASLRHPNNFEPSPKEQQEQAKENANKNNQETNNTTPLTSPAAR